MLNKCSYIICLSWHLTHSRSRCSCLC